MASSFDYKKRMRYNVLIGGQAGQGPNHLTKILAEALIKKGYFVFYSRDYQSLIRGGHNFNILTFSDELVYSNDSKIDVIVALDDNTEKIHKKDLKKDGKIIKTDSSDNEIGNKILNLFNLPKKKNGFSLMNGSQGIAEGSIKSGLDIYYAYPMTPATPLLFELAQREEKDNLLVFQPENEISVAIAGIGSALTGAKVMVGTSGGGFDLMTEALSLTGQAEVPIVFYLAQRPGPGTGVPTYTGQGDLMMALHSGHGEFSRLVLSPGDPVECQELISQAFYFSQKYRIPCIILSDKHLSEAAYPLLNKEKPVITKSLKSNSLIKYSSYESEDGIATSDPEVIKNNISRRLKKAQEIKKEAQKFTMYKIFGKKDSKNVVLSYGSTKGAILDSIEDLDVKFIQVLYLEPFPDIRKDLEDKKVILVENSSTGMLADLIREKTGIRVESKILRADGRPFLCDELKEEIMRLI
jgi:2-oxoglutarate ferredoxin oxidoreductase subunit alpha